MTVTKPLTVTVLDTDSTPKEGLSVYAFTGAAYTGFNGTTDANGQIIFTLPQGSYRFRADLNGTQFWSGAENHCAVPGCAAVGITVTIPVTVTVQDTDEAPKGGLNVYAYDGSTYTGYNGVTDSNGEAAFTLPQGSYRFRADLNGTQFWSGESNHCTLPGCESAQIQVTKPVSVTVLDSDSTPKEGLNVYAFEGSTFTGYQALTNANGQAIFTLPQGSYRFRADLNGTQFWSGAENHCDVPGCENASVTITKPVTVTVLDGNELPYPDLSVYTFDEATYTGFNGITDADGQTSFAPPQGSHHFCAGYDGVQFWSSVENDCTLLGCTVASM